MSLQKAGLIANPVRIRRLPAMNPSTYTIGAIYYWPHPTLGCGDGVVRV